MPISPLSLRGSLRYKARYKTAVWLGSLSSWGNGRDAQSWPSGHVYLPTASRGQPVQIVFCFFVFLVCLDITLKDVLLSLAFFLQYWYFTIENSQSSIYVLKTLHLFVSQCPPVHSYFPMKAKALVSPLTVISPIPASRYTALKTRNMSVNCLYNLSQDFSVLFLMFLHCNNGLLAGSIVEQGEENNFVGSSLYVTPP